MYEIILTRKFHGVFPLRTCGKKRSMDGILRASKESMVRGYHVYKDIWAPMIGEDLLCGIIQCCR